MSKPYSVSTLADRGVWEIHATQLSAVCSNILSSPLSCHKQNDQMQIHLFVASAPLCLSLSLLDSKKAVVVSLYISLCLRLIVNNDFRLHFENLSAAHIKKVILNLKSRASFIRLYSLSLENHRRSPQTQLPATPGDSKEALRSITRLGSAAPPVRSTPIFQGGRTIADPSRHQIIAVLKTLERQVETYLSPASKPCPAAADSIS